MNGVSRCGPYDTLVGLAYNEDGEGRLMEHRNSSIYQNNPLFGIYNAHDRSASRLSLISPVINNGIEDILVSTSDNPTDNSYTSINNPNVSTSSIRYIRFKIRNVSSSGVTTYNVDMDFSTNPVTINF